VFTLTMTSVSPQIRSPETVLDLEEDEKPTRPGLLFVTSNETTLGSEQVDSEAVPRRKITIEEGLRPLLASMKLFGLYFTRPSENKQSRRWNAHMIYAVSVVILLWVNALRVLSIFTHEDKFGMVLLTKLVATTWFMQCAVSQTAFYTASFSGRLAVVFHQVLDDSCARNARKFSTFYTVVAWTVIVSGSAFFAYGFFSDMNMMDVMLAPFQVHIIVSHPLVLRIITSFISVYCLSAYILSQVITFVLAMIFSHQFMKVRDSLRRCLDNHQRQVSDQDIETLRQRHQEISMNVSNVDDSLMFSNASAFCCQLFCLILLLYILTFYHSLITDAVVVMSQVFWLLTVSIGLVLTAAGGIIVHHHVSLFTVSAVLTTILF